MIIKLHLPDDQLETLLELSGNAGLGLEDFLSRFIEDVTADPVPVCLEDWLASLNMPEEDMEETVILSQKQMELMSLMDQILANDG